MCNCVNNVVGTGDINHSVQCLCVQNVLYMYCVSQKEVDTNVEANFIKNRNFLKLPVSSTNKCSLDFQCDKYQSN